MKKLVACLLLLSFSAAAGDRLLGVIQTPGVTKSNISQNPDGGYNFWDGGFVQPFCIPEMALLTMQCDNAMYICTDKTACTAIEGVKVDPNVVFLTSVAAWKGSIYQAGVNDGGVAGSGAQIQCAAVSILDQVTDGGYHSCKVFERNGKE